MALQSGQNFRLSPDLVGNFSRGLQTAGQIQQLQGASQKRDINAQTQALTGQILDPQATPQQKIEAQRQLTALNPEAAQQVLATEQSRIKGVTDRESANFRSVAQAAVQVDALPSVEAKQDFLRRRIVELDADPSRTSEDTKIALDLFESGRVDEANAQIKEIIAAGERLGFIESANTSGIRQESNLLRSRELSLKESEAERRALQLSPTAQTILDKSQTSAIDSATRASSLNILAGDLDKTEVGGGVAATFKERLKELTGDQDAVTNLRKQFNQVRITLAIQNLPPGVASDKDIELALAGFPTDKANKFQMVSFLRGMSKLEKINEGFQTFKSETISNQRDTKGLLKKWKTKVFSNKLGRKVENSELYITAANKGLTIDDVRQQLEVE